MSQPSAAIAANGGRPIPRALSGRSLSSRHSSSASTGSIASVGSNDNGRGRGNLYEHNGTLAPTSRPATRNPLLFGLRWVQDRLDFRGSGAHPQFATEHGLGRVAVYATVLGGLWAAHAGVLLLLALRDWGYLFFDLGDGADDGSGGIEPAAARIQMIRQWCMYFVALVSFHLLEFFVTAIWNPSVVTANSFVVNQSLAYSAAALVSWGEFWARFVLNPVGSNSPSASRVGLIVVFLGQLCRALAMITCGESFNHIIQRTKEDTHVLITRGVYRIFRHPSYVGFYYWSVGTQLLLSNPICIFGYALASGLFFKKRIPYEEKTLVEYFPEEYPDYMAETWIGIPFVRSTPVGGSKMD